MLTAADPSTVLPLTFDGSTSRTSRDLVDELLPEYCGEDDSAAAPPLPAADELLGLFKH